MTTKRERLTAFNKNNILEAAGGLFEARGLDQTTMDDIARAAEYSKSTIYVYFKSKDDIYYHLLFEGMSRLYNQFKSACNGNGTDAAHFEKIYFSLCYALAAFRQEHPLYFDGMLNAIKVADSDFQAYPVLRDIYEVGEKINHLLEETIKDGIAAGLLRADLDPLPTIFSLWASLGGIIGMADQKRVYFNEKLGLTQERFLQHGFTLLLNAIKTGGAL